MTIVRGTAGIGAIASTPTFTPRLRRHSSELTPKAKVNNPQIPTPIENSPMSRSPTLYPPRNERDKTEDFFTRLRNCHTTSIGNSTVNVNSPYACEPPPFKRSRSSSICSQSLSLSRDGEVFPRRSSQSQTPRAPRQVTLDSLRNWKLPGSAFAKTNSIQSSPAPRSFMDLHAQPVSTPTSVITRRKSGSELFSPFPQQQRQGDRDVESVFPPVMPAAVKAVLGKSPAPVVSARRCPSPDDSLRHLRRSVSVSMLFESNDFVESSPTDVRLYTILSFSYRIIWSY